MAINVIKLWGRAKEAAKSALTGGLEKKAAKLKEQMKELGVNNATSAALSVASYGLGKIPLVGSEVSFVFNKAIADPAKDLVNSKTVEHLLQQAQARDVHKLIQYRSEQALTFMDDMFAEYTVMRDYFSINMSSRGLPESCDAAYKQAYEYALAKSCITDLEKHIALLEELTGLLKGEVQKMKPGIKARKDIIKARLALWGIGHPDKRCNGLQGCFWDGKKDLNPSDIFDEDL
jgi:hypothetical protein